MNTFPPHWFTMHRDGITVKFKLIPCTCVIDSVEWCLFTDGLRALDLGELVPSLAKHPDRRLLILCYVDTIDTAHYLMECCRTVLACYDEKDREKLFAVPPIFQAPMDPPGEPLPPGHPDSFSMEELLNELGNLS